MRVELGYYGEYIKVMDSCSFSLADIQKAQTRVFWETGKNVTLWPLTIELNERTEFWEVYFLTPLNERN